MNGAKADEDATPPVVDEIDGAIMVGARNPGSEFFTGLIDNVFLYNRILSPKEIARDMRDTSELSSNPLPESEATDVQRNVVLNWEPGEFAVKHDVYFGTVFADVNSADTTNTAVDFGGALAQHVRITVTAGWGMLPQYGISEVRFLYIPALAREPMPADGETTESVGVVLDWRAGREAASHQVYLGTDAENLPMVGTTDESSYDAGALDYDLLIPK